MMEPIRTRSSNFVFRGPDPTVGDAWVERKAGQVYLVWQLTDDERQAIAGGANLRMGLYTHTPIPPVSLGVTDEQPLSPEGERWRDMAKAILMGVSPGGPDAVPPGYWMASPTAWIELQQAGALDGGDGVPTLYGRPLMESPVVEGDLAYVLGLGDAQPGPLQ